MARKLDSIPFLQACSSYDSYSSDNQANDDEHEEPNLLSKVTDDIDFDMGDDYDNDSIPEEGTPCQSESL